MFYRDYVDPIDYVGTDDCLYNVNSPKPLTGAIFLPLSVYLNFFLQCFLNFLFMFLGLLLGCACVLCIHVCCVCMCVVYTCVLCIDVFLYMCVANEISHSFLSKIIRLEKLLIIWLVVA